MASNSNLQRANKEKNDEFYTQLVDIENELKHYKEHFKNKVVFCNCDDPYESNFFKYFAMNFNFLGLKKLICTCYDSSPIAYTQLTLCDGFDTVDIKNNNKKAYKIEITDVCDADGNGAYDMADVKRLLKSNKNTLTKLKGNGDFRSEECIELLKQADIVVTNPPFSLFGEYIAQLVEYKKKFLIIGNMNAITYKSVFPMIIENKIWTGFSFNKTFEFIMSHDYVLKGKAFIDNQGRKHGFVPAICWFTNLIVNKRFEKLVLYKKYSQAEYPKYDNYDAIEVGRVTEIPEDYDGVMGVPITFLDKYNPDQFEIVGCTESEGKGFSFGLWKKESNVAQPLINGVKAYKRLFIRRKQNDN